MADDGFTIEQRKILERWANLEIEDKEAISSLSPNGQVHLRHSSKYDVYTLRRLENEKRNRANEWYTKTSNIRAELAKKIDTDDDVENAVNLALQKLDDWAELKLSNDELSEYIGYAIRSPFRNNTVFSEYLLTHLRNKLKGVDCNTEKDDTKGMTDNTIKDVKFISFLTEFQARLVSLSEFIEGYLSESEKDFEEYCADLYREQGYTVTVTQKTRDGGYDLLLSKQEDRFGETYTYRAIVECKNYSDTKICDSLVKKLVGANAEVKADKCIFITTSTFTEPAKVYAANVGVQLIDGKALKEMEERVNKS